MNDANEQNGTVKMDVPQHSIASRTTPCLPKLSIHFSFFLPQNNGLVLAVSDFSNGKWRKKKKKKKKNVTSSSE
uniref:Uncharacterized protein n=1 Tax=Onchocerca volvulus TaxID=6282 RepID=A0A8R1XTX6_ONCVO